MEETKKSVKVNCSFCGSEMECPESMLKNAKKHMCYNCFQRSGNLAEEEDAGEVHVDIPMDKMEEFIPENLADSLMEEFFPVIWSERKEELKALSKRDLAEKMFGTGAYIAIRQMMAVNRQDLEEDENEPEEQD